MTVALTYGSLDLNDRGTSTGTCSFYLQPGLDLGSPELSAIMRSNVRSSGADWVRGIENNRQLTIPLMASGASATGLAAGLTTLWSECLADTNTLSVTLPGQSARTFNTFRADPEISLTDILLTQTKTYDLDLKIPAKPWAEGTLTSWTQSAISQSWPISWAVTGVAGDTLDPAALAITGAASQSNTWMIGRRENFNASFNGVFNASGTASATCYNNDYQATYIASGYAGVPISVYSTSIGTVAQMKGKYRGFLRATASTDITNVTYYLELNYGGGPVWPLDIVGTTKTNNNLWEVVDLGLISIPPTPLGGTLDESASITATLYATSPTYATTIYVDFLCLIPTDGGFVRFANPFVDSDHYVLDFVGDIPTIGAVDGPLSATSVPQPESAKPATRIGFAESNNLVALAYTANNATTSDSVKDVFAVYQCHKPRYLLL